VLQRRKRRIPWGRDPSAERVVDGSLEALEQKEDLSRRPARGDAAELFGETGTPILVRSNIYSSGAPRPGAQSERLTFGNWCAEEWGGKKTSESIDDSFTLRKSPIGYSQPA